VTGSGSGVVSADWVLPVDAPPIEGGAVAWENGAIVAVAPAAELPAAGRHYGDAVVMPGFVNAHTHLEYAVYGGFGDGRADFSEWLALHIERKARIDWDEFVSIAELGAAECLRSGVTSVGDCSYSGAAAVACERLGLGGVVYLEVFGMDPAKALERFARLRERAGSAWEADLGLGVSPHAPYSTSLDVYAACAELGVPLATHLSESPSEVEYLTRGTGAWAAYEYLLPPPRTTGTRLLAAAGLLGPGVVAAHCTVVDREEIGLLARSGTGVAHCPRSNAALGCGVAPLAELRSAGARVGVGTDSPASAPSFDFFDELRSATLGARARETNASAVASPDAIALGTLGGARALGLDHERGSLTPGKRADLTVVSLEGSPYLPWEDPATAVLWGGSPERVLTTVVRGEVRYERDRFAWQELRRNAARARRRLLADAPLRVRP
jgi:cytosine/adenosine deaminase-related metal-dependent hydrolase